MREPRLAAEEAWQEYRRLLGKGDKLPGICIGIGLMALCYFISKRNKSLSLNNA
jgi:hypothetical protein